MIPLFGPYANLVTVLVAEVQQSIYQNHIGEDVFRFFARTPYFARVQIEQVELSELRKSK